MQLSTSISLPVANIKMKNCSCGFLLVLVVLSSLETVSLDENPGKPAQISCDGKKELDECVFKTDNLDDCANMSVLCDCESLVALNASEFEYVDENTVSFNGLTLTIELNTSQGLPVVCANFSQNETVLGESLREKLAGSDIIFYVGDTLSIVGCSLLLLTFCLFKELRTFPAKIVVNIAVSVQLTSVLRIVTVGGAFKISGFCDAVAISSHFFTLAQSLWMTIMSCETCLSF